MKYKNYIFDLYGTLIDIHTDEKNPKLWEYTSDYFETNFGTVIDSKKLNQEYFKLCKSEEKRLAKENGSKHPEIKIEWVWEKLIGKPVSDVEMRRFCNDFRETSRVKLKRYDGVAETLAAIKEAGGKIYLLSNAQRLYTEKEMEDTDITKYFDDIFISSDKGIKKPDGNFLQELLDKHSLIKDECVMIGNEVLADVGVATAVGIDAILLNTYNHPSWDLKRDFARCGADMDKVKVILEPTFITPSNIIA
ncbi:putative hydrolase of the HAD superfamily [Pseudobutyrivibrio sp. 49]|uniref:HAD family hydrolase n=1 Tax=Pseudobutyrivibrio sp. 49 TaxID=1855344 RepID=UPI00087F02FB|nr:HAD family hydrolase [Pseudobutyrivibrio sp. 49]SDI60375.1 putative hydrolase of the HAD superfamily [Pseudobutyrivibrio sp. 49]